MYFNIYKQHTQIIITFNLIVILIFFKLLYISIFLIKKRILYFNFQKFSFYVNCKFKPFYQHSLTFYKYLKYIYTVAATRFKIAILLPNLKNFIKSILHPAFAEADTATTFVAEPIIVILPPKQEP